MLKISGEYLHTVCKPVTMEEAPGLSYYIDHMFNVMEKKGGVGLAANQVGLNKQIICVNHTGLKFVLINPIIEKFWGGKARGIEGCLSFPGQQVEVWRSRKIRVSGFNEKMEPIVRSYNNFIARIVQHEVDHVNGIDMFQRSKMPLR